MSIFRSICIIAISFLSHSLFANSSILWQTEYSNSFSYTNCDSFETIDSLWQPPFTVAHAADKFGILDSQLILTKYANDSWANAFYLRRLGNLIDGNSLKSTFRFVQPAVSIMPAETNL